ncbi:EAL domain-containing protein [Pseudomonas sp. R-28-1W-6]|uniref:bifunctional diguanylate cyclase/phosphodiesterase n=1 Tax=Pseudomonas sp. R-28-1W-6 TaxID=2650101 RepID=UPI0013658280|nr:EAL domain-containing protein [Pseudomonas sp. R-28-1W-6]MWV10712.1 EAL domain-containing protein [Pseudomonas sp. R-28-1W-6]
MAVDSDRLPGWTWWLPLPLFHLGTWLSLSSQFASGAALWYLPFALGLTFVLWWGPRVLPALYLNAVLSIPLWGLDWHWAPLYALSETLGVGLAWLLLRRPDFDAAMASVPSLMRFILLGVLLPVALVALGVQGNLLLTGVLAGGQWWPATLTLWLADSLASFGVALPLLTLLTPWLRRHGWARPGPQASAPSPLTAPPWWALLGLLLTLPLLLFSLPPLLVLPLIGVMMLVLALLWGFSGALCGAVLTALSVLALPLVGSLGLGGDWQSPQRLEMHFSVLLLVVAALLVGRALSDLRHTLQSSAALQKELALANLALQACPLGVSISDARRPGNPFIYCNPALERISGYRREEILGSASRLLLAGKEDHGALLRARQALSRGLPHQEVLRNYRKNGEEFWNEVIIAPLLDERGKVSHFVALNHDVSERERLGEELARGREELLRQTHLLSQTEAIADIGGWVLEMADQRMYWTDGCFRMNEMDPADGAPSLQVALSRYDRESRRLIEQTLAQIMRSGQAFDMEVRLSGVRGTARWVRLKGVPEMDGPRMVRLYGAIQDISARKRAEQQLRERDEWLRLFFEAPLIGMAMINPQGQWLEVNYKLCQILGRSREELRNSSWRRITHAEDVPPEAALFDAINRGERDDYELEKRFLRRDGSVLYSRLSLRAVRGPGGKLEACLALIEDITERHEAQARYRTLVEHAPEAIVLFSPRGGIIEANENALRLFKLGHAELLGKSPSELSPPRQANGEESAPLAREYLDAAINGGTPVFEWLHRDSVGHLLPCEVRLVRMPGQPLLIRGSITDISERQRYQREIERLAYSDELTGLPNRRLLQDRLQQAMAREQREERFGALLFIDLDHFKTVNDSLGHPSGDALLKAVSDRLSGCLRAEDTLARLGGDEFVVLLENLASNPAQAAEYAAEVGEKLLASLQGSYLIHGHELAVSASIGITLHPLPGQGAADALKQSDTAMYQAKQGGRNALHFFAPEMQAVIDQRLLLQSELRQAMSRDQLYLVFQPQLELDSGAVAGAEVLLRWQHPERGDIPPTQFIPLAEETGLIQELGCWVLEQACVRLASWQARWPQLVLALNLSPRELRQPDCAERINACLLRHGLPASALELEITEGVLLEDVERCIAAMQALKQLGIRFAIDDFGTGYSSLTYLKRLPLDRLKIDRSFIHDLQSDASGQMLVETILLIARNLGLACVAEGIEDEAQLDWLRSRGCALGQGYYFARPMAEAEFLQWMRAYQAGRGPASAAV